MSGNDSKETFKALSTSVDDLVRETVREDFAGEWRDVDAGGLAFEDVTEGFEVAVASSDG